MALDLPYRAARKISRKPGFRYEYLYWHLRRFPARNILEIGVYRGVRSHGFVTACLGKLPASDIHFYGVDLFEQYGQSDQGTIDKEFASAKAPLSSARMRASLAKLLPQENIHLLVGSSEQVFKTHGEHLPPMDFIFIDGGHSLDTIQTDFAYCSKLISPTGTLFLDDYWLSRDAGCRVLYESLSSELWEKSLFPVPDFYGDTVGFIWLARVRRRISKDLTRKGGGI